MEPVKFSVSELDAVPVLREKLLQDNSGFRIVPPSIPTGRVIRTDSMTGEVVGHVISAVSLAATIYQLFAARRNRQDNAQPININFITQIESIQICDQSEKELIHIFRER